MSTFRSAKNRLSAVLGAFFILGLAAMLYVLASTLTAGGYSAGAALERSGSSRGGGTDEGQDALAGGVPKDVAVDVHAVLGGLDFVSTDPGLPLYPASFSPTGLIDEVPGAPAAPFDLIVPQLSEVPSGLSDTISGANGNAAFGPSGTPGLSLGGSPGRGGSDSAISDAVISDATTTSVPEPSGLILLGLGLVSVAGAPRLSRRGSSGSRDAARSWVSESRCP